MCDSAPATLYSSRYQNLINLFLYLFNHYLLLSLFGKKRQRIDLIVVQSLNDQRLLKTTTTTTTRLIVARVRFLKQLLSCPERTAKVVIL